MPTLTADSSDKDVAYVYDTIKNEIDRNNKLLGNEKPANIGEDFQYKQYEKEMEKQQEEHQKQQQ